MTRQRLRLAIFLTLFVAWLSYLGYLALIRKPPIIVSRIQALNATSWLVADIELDEAGRPLRVVHRLESMAQGGQAIEGEKIIVENLPQAMIPPRKPIPGKGKYLLLLTKAANMPPLPAGEREIDLNKVLGTLEQKYLVASTASGAYDDSSRPPLIYPWTPEVEQQIRTLFPGR